MDDVVLMPRPFNNALGVNPILPSCSNDGRIDALFFDFHGTISNNLFWQSSDITLFREASTYLFNNDTHLAHNWMTGALATIDICEALQNRFDRPAGIFCSAIFCDISKWKIEDEIVKLIGQLRNCVDRIFMVSDNTDVFANWFSRSPYRALFDDVWVSSDYGTLKNDGNGGAYRKLAREHDVDLTRSVLFDDSIRSISTFERLGGGAVQVTNTGHTVQLCRAILRSKLGHAVNRPDVLYEVGRRRDPQR